MAILQKREDYQLLKNKVPYVYNTVIKPRIFNLNQKLENLRKEYSQEKNQEKKVFITQQANIIKKELALYD